MVRLIVALLERFSRYLTRRLGEFELTEPVVVRHGDSWLRIAPGEPPRWFPTEAEALAGSRL